VAVNAIETQNMKPKEEILGLRKLIKLKSTLNGMKRSRGNYIHLKENEFSFNVENILEEGHTYFI
jgi:hypothetical protein